MSRKPHISGWSTHLTRSSERLSEIPMEGSRFVVRGNGRSYGDASLAPQHLDATKHRGILQVDESTHTLICSSGFSLREILNVTVPLGFYLPVMPGTSRVSLGGMIAADVHGKNHRTKGCIGHWIQEITLITPDGEQVSCSAEQRNSLFNATIGGMGLSGEIISAKLSLMPLNSSRIQQTTIAYPNMHDLINGFREHESEYAVAWINTLEKNMFLLNLGEHVQDDDPNLKSYHLGKAKISIPFYAPSFLLNSTLMKIYNRRHFKRSIAHPREQVDLDAFFFPLDQIEHWNKLYGKTGLLQYQFVIPEENAANRLQQLLDSIENSPHTAFLAVLKHYGPKKSPGFLSFPMAGYSLALDFKMHRDLPDFLHKLDALILSFGGRIYLAKDACMKGDDFQNMYPNLNTFREALQANSKRRWNSDLAARLGIHNTKHMKQKHVLILGGNSDIAKAAAKAYNKAGYGLTLAGRRTDDLETFKVELNPAHPVEIVFFDATAYETHAAFYANLTYKPSVVLCAFGLLGDTEKALADFSHSQAIIDANFTGAVSILNLIAQDMSVEGSGTIIGISSVAADRGKGSNLLYSAAKAGFDSYLTGLRNKLHNRGVRVVTIRPGFVRTKMLARMETPGQLTATAEEVARVILNSTTGKRNIIYVKPIWKWVMLIIRCIPEFIFKKMSF